jgi:hypothetical protein
MRPKKRRDKGLSLDPTPPLQSALTVHDITQRELTPILEERTMRRTTVLVSTAALAIGITAGAGWARQQPQGPQPFFVGNRLGLPVNPAADGKFEAISTNVKVFGSIYSAESCSYDPQRG